MIRFFDVSKNSDAPSSEIHMELGVAFEEFWSDAAGESDKLSMPYQCALANLSEFRVRIECGKESFFVKDDEEVLFYCGEEMIILSEMHITMLPKNICGHCLVA